MEDQFLVSTWRRRWRQRVPGVRDPLAQMTAVLIEINRHFDVVVVAALMQHI